jgi:hypothetical protein
LKCQQQQLAAMQNCSSVFEEHRAPPVEQVEEQPCIDVSPDCVLLPEEEKYIRLFWFVLIHSFANQSPICFFRPKTIIYKVNLPSPKEDRNGANAELYQRTRAYQEASGQELPPAGKPLPYMVVNSDSEHQIHRWEGPENSTVCFILLHSHYHTSLTHTYADSPHPPKCSQQARALQAAYTIHS